MKFYLLLGLLINLLNFASVSAFFSAFAMSDASRSKKREIYDIPGSGWVSPKWNWGSAAGTGHDAALICRRRWGSTDARKALVEALLNPKGVSDETLSSIESVDESRQPPFEEVKLVLGLAWQNGRWDGSDGGRGGYGDILSSMAAAKRYESDDEKINAERFVEDMVKRFDLIASSSEAKDAMRKIESDCGADIDAARRKCSGMVLNEMGFIKKGL